MDKIDRSILSIFRKMPYSKCGTGRPCWLVRICLSSPGRQPEQSGLITGYHARLSHEKLGHSVLVLVHITLHGQSADMLSDFEKAVRNVPQVLACFLLAGESDYLLRIAARDVTDYGRIHSEYLSALPHVLRMESNFALREVNRGLSAEEL